MKLKFYKAPIKLAGTSGAIKISSAHKAKVDKYKGELGIAAFIEKAIDEKIKRDNPVI